MSCDPNGNFIPLVLAAVAIFEIVSSAADVVATVDVWTDPTASTGERIAVTAGTAIGLVGPGGGAGAAAKHTDEVIDAVDGVVDARRAARRRGGAGSTKGAGVDDAIGDGAREATSPEGVVYRRTDLTGDLEPYGGQAVSPRRYIARQREHARAHPDSVFEFEIVDRADPGVDLDIA